LKFLRQPQQLHSYFLSADWLPGEGRDFELVSKVVTLFSCKMREKFFSLGPRRYFEESIRQTVSEFDAAT